MVVEEGGVMMMAMAIAMVGVVKEGVGYDSLTMLVVVVVMVEVARAVRAVRAVRVVVVVARRRRAASHACVKA